MTGANGLGDLMRDPEEAERRLDQWATGLEEKAQRYAAAQERTEQLRLTASSSDGAVKVTVGADGGVTAIDFGNKARTYPLEELSRQILATMHQAQSGIATQVAEVMQESLGDEDQETRALMIGTLRSRFPEIEDEESPAPPPPPPPPAPSGEAPPPPPQAPRDKRHEAPDDEENSPW
ncbi:YbaB/EbfC family nucleoid-associated protein [Amycolatopsis pittospori]|uniref:YbaB/EbfC family nucleoid-associated protein n=1 Tax=Amycolatopsis pittospori TaxID=2749434 RepID=UPI0015EFF3A2|nr:YbaB/EbfC family nucleoid-associated protein [Amycolatopsis pittospori]